MTVGELITELNKYPQDMELVSTAPVCYDGETVDTQGIEVIALGNLLYVGGKGEE